MDEEVGYVNISGIPNVLEKQTGISDTRHYYDKIDKAVQKWLGEGKDNTKKLVEQHWDKIEKLSQLLLKQEVVYESELENILT